MDEALIEETRRWLGEEGLAFFSKLLEDHGKVDPVLIVGRQIPHPVHWREGMQVRNFLRQHVDWDQEELDNRWTEVVEKCIRRK